MSSNPAHDKVCSIQHYMIKFVSDLRQVSGVSGYYVSSTNKTNRQDITEIQLKVSLNSIALPVFHISNMVKRNLTSLQGLCTSVFLSDFSAGPVY